MEMAEEVGQVKYARGVAMRFAVMWGNAILNADASNFAV